MRKRHVLAIILFVVSAAVIFIASWGTNLETEFEHTKWPKSENLASAEADFAQDLAKFQSLVEQALAWRTSATNSITKLRAKSEAGAPLGPEDLLYVHEGSEIYAGIRREMLALAHKYKHLVSAGVQIDFQPGRSTKATFAADGESVTEVRLDPKDQYGDLLLRQYKLSLAAALVLYDNFLIAIWPYNETGKLRSLINFDNTKLLNGLKEVSANYLNPDYRRRVHLAVIYFQYDQAWRKSQGTTSNVHSYLDTLINGSPTLAAASAEEWTETRSMRWLNSLVLYFDALGIFQKESMNIVSALFGNAVGLVEVRQGKLMHLPPTEFNQIKATLRPLDILLEKTPFRLTDKLIPGYYGHVAVWLGTEEDLKARGLWDDPKFKPYQAQINSGHSIVEALRSGVQLSTLEHFLNIDDLAVVRYRVPNKQAEHRYLSLAVAQIGKEYDFNFDVETDKRIVCSELAYVVFPDLPWPIAKAAGRYTISPDNVASLVVRQRANFEVPLLYNDGQAVQEKRFERFAGLLGEVEK